MIKQISYDGYKGQSRSLKMGRLNLLTGPNGSGKTTVYEAIHIAIKGKHPYLGDTLQAIRKQCSSDKVSFVLDDDNLAIARSIEFGDKTVHSVSINGADAKVKEAQSAIDEVYTDSMMRLDIGKFSKMNDVDRGVVLSDLLGSVKVNSSELSLDIDNAFFRSNPESDYVIKYRLSAIGDNYDKKEFIKAMRELYTDKNPVIMEMVDTCGKIMGEHSGLVEAAETLDAIYEAIKKLKNAKAQEKQYAQKAFSEISGSEIPADDITSGINEKESEMGLLNVSIAKLQSLAGMLAALLPATDIEVIEASLSELEPKSAVINDAQAALKKELQSIEGAVISLDKKLELIRDFSNWEEKISGYERAVSRLESEIKDNKAKIAPESKDKIKDLESIRAAFLALRETPAGECPTCGTYITEAAASERKAKIKEAKAQYEIAGKEMKVRQENGMLKAKIEMGEKQLKEAKQSLLRAKELIPAKPEETEASIGAQKADVNKRRNEISQQISRFQREMSEISTEKARLEAERDKHVKYGDLLETSLPVFEMHDIQKDDPISGINQAMKSLREKLAEVNEEYVKYRAAEQLSERLSKEQIRILDLTVAYDTLNKYADIVRQYKNDLVQRKIAPVQMLAKKYYHNKTDEIVITPKTIGVNRKGGYIEQGAMSSGESLSLMSSVIIAIMEASGAKPNYLFIDAAEIDVANMHILMEALEKSSLETIMVAHHMPIEANENWNCIRLGG